MFYEKFTYPIIVQLVLKIYILKYILCIHYEQLCLGIVNIIINIIIIIADES
jgi:hypothetical protein